MFETEMFPSDPGWLADHRVYGRVIMPGALFGAMAATVLGTEGAGGVAIEELQLLNPLVYPEYDGEDAAAEPGKRVQLVVDGGKGSQPRSFEIFSKGEGDEAWTAHAEGQLSRLEPRTASLERVDPDALKAGLEPQDLPAYYRAKAATGIDLGPGLPQPARTVGQGRRSPGRSRATDTGRRAGRCHPSPAAGRVFSGLVGHPHPGRHWRGGYLPALCLGMAMAERAGAGAVAVPRPAAGDGAG